MNMTYQRVPADILVALLGLTQSVSFVRDTERLHGAMQRASAHYPIISQNFTFTTHTPFPFSNKLDESLSLIGLSRIIESDADFQFYRVTKSGKRIAQEILLLFEAEEQLELRELAELFDLECGTNIRPN